MSRTATISMVGEDDCENWAGVKSFFRDVLTLIVTLFVRQTLRNRDVGQGWPRLSKVGQHGKLVKAYKSGRLANLSNNSPMVGRQDDIRIHEGRHFI